MRTMRENVMRASDKSAKAIDPMMFFIIVVFVVASFISMDVYLPSLPAMTKSMQTTSRLAQMTLTMYLVDNQSSVE